MLCSADVVVRSACRRRRYRADPLRGLEPPAHPAVDERLLEAEIERVLSVVAEQRSAAAGSDGFGDVVKSAISATAAGNAEAKGTEECAAALPSSAAAEMAAVPSADLPRMYTSEEEWELVGVSPLAGTT